MINYRRGGHNFTSNVCCPQDGSLALNPSGALPNHERAEALARVPAATDSARHAQFSTFDVSLIYIRLGRHETYFVRHSL